MYDDKNGSNPKSVNYKRKAKKAKKEEAKASSTAVANGDAATTTTTTSSEETHTAAEQGDRDVEANPESPQSEEEEVEQPQMSVPLTIGLLIVVTVVSRLLLSFHRSYARALCVNLVISDSSLL